jgi:hypothetical protein
MRYFVIFHHQPSHVRSRPQSFLCGDCSFFASNLHPYILLRILVTAVPFVKRVGANGAGRIGSRLRTTYRDASPANSDDRHVLAAAINAHADFIVTINLKDFPPTGVMPHRIEIVHPDQRVGP